MYEGSGQVVHDLSGKGNNGKLGSTPGVDDNDPTWIKGFLVRLGAALRRQRLRPDPGLAVARAAEADGLRLGPRHRRRPATRARSSARAANGCDVGVLRALRVRQRRPALLRHDGRQRYRSTAGLDPAAIWNGKWHHVAGTYDGTTAKLFVDGKLDRTTARRRPRRSTTRTTGDDLGIGDYLGTCDLFYSGDIDDVAIFSQALPVDKIWSAVSLLFRPLR